MHLPTSRQALLSIGASVLLPALFSFSAHAQQVYRQVGPDGRVTFSDRPAATVSKTTAVTENASVIGSDVNALTRGLPFELRSTVGKFPVTLYTSDDCTPCVSGRQMLGTRGIPYLEKTVKTEDDAKALQQLSGQGSLPVLTIGGKRLLGFSESEWSQYLNAANYPAQSQLPPAYVRPTATALVAPKPEASNPTTGSSESAAARPAPSVPAAPKPAPTPNPAGIVF